VGLNHCGQNDKKPIFGLAPLLIILPSIVLSIGLAHPVLGLGDFVEFANGHNSQKNFQPRISDDTDKQS
jgi:hypothetical protein